MSDTTTTEEASSVPDPASVEGDRDTPQVLAEAARKAAVGELDARDPEGKPVTDQPADRDSYIAGIDAGIRAMLRLVPSGDPTAFAIEQLWIHQRWMADSLIAYHLRRQADAILAMRPMVERLDEKLTEYEEVLPAPGSLAARVGRLGGRRREWAPGGSDGR